MIVVNDLVAVLLQCFLIILAGYVSGRLRLISNIESQGISKFVTYFALPALVFRSLAQLDFSDFNWAFVVSILVSKVFIFILISASVMLMTQPCDLSLAGLFAIFCTQSNDFAVGYPIISSLYSQSHPSYSKYLYVLAPIQLVILNPVGFFMMEIQKQDNLLDPHQRRQSIASILSVTSVTSTTSIESSMNQPSADRSKGIIIPVLKGILSNPIIVMTFVGIGWNLAFTSHIPPLIDRALEVLSLSFSASALFLLGLNMVGKFALFKCSFNLGVTCLLVLIKLVILPVVIRLFIDFVFTKDIDTSLARFSFLYGTIPAAPTSLIFALQYGLPTDTISSAIVLSTFLSAPIMFVYANMQV